MKRIKTAIYKKKDKAEDTKAVYILELVEGDNGTFYLLSNDIDCATGKFKKINLFKSHNDLEEVNDIFNLACQDKVAENYKPAVNGDDFTGLKFLLEYTESYVDKRDHLNIVQETAEKPRLLRL
jgi:hypothetical protein